MREKRENDFWPTLLMAVGIVLIALLFVQGSITGAAVFSKFFQSKEAVAPQKATAPVQPQKATAPVQKSVSEPASQPQKKQIETNVVTYVADPKERSTQREEFNRAEDELVVATFQTAEIDGYIRIDALIEERGVVFPDGALWRASIPRFNDRITNGPSVQGNAVMVTVTNVGTEPTRVCYEYVYTNGNLKAHNCADVGVLYEPGESTEVVTEEDSHCFTPDGLPCAGTLAVYAQDHTQPIIPGGMICSDKDNDGDHTESSEHCVALQFHKSSR